MRIAILCCCCCVLLASCAAGVVTSSSPLPVPPALPGRAIAPTTPPEDSISIDLTIRDVKGTLFLPPGWQHTSESDAQLVIHFHTIAWFTIQEHLRRGSRLPLLNFAIGEGSATYARPFLEPAVFQEWLRVVEKELARHGDSTATPTPIRRVEISSFSAGYGSVREILKVETNRQVIQRIVLCDSLYGSLVDTNATGRERTVTPEHIAPWLEFARAAARGEKTFLLTTSDVPTPRYASTRECGEALAAAVGAPFIPMDGAPTDATLDPDFPLLRRADLGHFHVWNYAGTNAPAHLTHVRHVADLWRSLDTAREIETPR